MVAIGLPDAHSACIRPWGLMLREAAEAKFADKLAGIPRG